RVSQTIIVLSNPVQMFQITAINSGTSLTVTPAASPALSGQKYGILVTDSLSVDGLAQSMSQFINEYDENIGAWETFASTSANQLVTVTINGTSLSIPAIGGLARKGANNDITELKGLTTALSIAQGGTGAKTAADARTNLSLGSSSTADTQTSSTDTSSGRVLKVGAFGLGANTITPPADTYTGFFSQGIGGNTNPDSVYGYAHLVMSVSGTYRTRMAQTYFGTPRLWLQNIDGSTYSTWAQVYTTANTTKASDGTLKAASPIVQIFADGSYELNDES
ncbi:phage tail fiber protein, partial [Pseudocitrobacter sp. MW920760]|uniref:phage tail fiber protein n=1 Tax=Pseudocitrobacter sp. MW920760 TaxID=2981140 RepID=UPI002EC70189|nr:phage tail protein [Pseudocitrobacter sp. MW920760]